MDPHTDNRNVTDEFKGKSEDEIIAELDARGVQVEIAIENTLRDFNMGSIVRTANAFGIRTVHVVGRKQWNKRGAMMTDKYLHTQYHESFSDLRTYANSKQYRIVAVDNVPGSIPLEDSTKESTSILLFGQEGPGLSKEALQEADTIVAIEQSGSTRSLNVGVAAGIAIYTWLH